MGGQRDVRVPQNVVGICENVIHGDLIVRDFGVLINTSKNTKLEL